jgi:hypothetical protein
VYGSGKTTPQPGDIKFTVMTQRTPDPGDPTGNSWLVNVQVTWPNNQTGISQSVIVTRQKAFAQ